MGTLHLPVIQFIRASYYGLDPPFFVIGSFDRGTLGLQLHDDGAPHHPLPLNLLIFFYIFFLQVLLPNSLLGLRTPIFTHFLF